MESDKSVYALVAVFALILIIVGGIVIFYILNSFVSKIKDNTGKTPALIVGIGRVLQRIPIGVMAELTANQIYKDEILQRREEENIDNENVGRMDFDGNVICGNGVKERIEECDDGNVITETCDYDKNCPEICNSNCKKVNVQGAYCSDGITQREFGEECDDGNLIFGDGCDSKCKEEIMPMEDENIRNNCEDSDLNNEYSDGKNVKEKGYVKWTNDNGASGINHDECDTSDLNKVYEVYCKDNKFKRDLIDCPNGEACYDGRCNVENVCGNGIVEEGEICDPPGSESECITNNGYPGKRACYNLCIIYAECQTTFRCGDLICNGPENATNCGIDCGVAVCGNGVKERGEGCDDNNTQDGDDCPSNCVFENVCIDSDGYDLLTFGNVTVDSLNDNKDPILYSDFCISNSIVEFYCTDYNNVYRISTNCPEGYICPEGAGACVQVSSSPEFNNFNIVEKVWERLKILFI